MSINHQNRFAAEAFGTFALVFTGTGAIVVNQVSSGTITHAGVAFTFGLIVLAMIYAVGDVSGAHLNPAVTIALAAAGRISWNYVPLYIFAQLTGAFSASLSLSAIFPTNSSLGSTVPSGSPWQSAVLEIILTLLLMFVILSVTTGAGEKSITAGIAIGAVIALEAMFAGPISGASMNPARSIAPGIVSGHYSHLWVYIFAPILGALLSVPIFRSTRFETSRM